MPDSQNKTRHFPETEGGRIYRDGRWLHAIHMATPKEVWDEYERDGIPIHIALRMEASYAG